MLLLIAVRLGVPVGAVRPLGLAVGHVPEFSHPATVGQRRRSGREHLGQCLAGGSGELQREQVVGPGASEVDGGDRQPEPAAASA